MKKLIDGVKTESERKKSRSKYVKECKFLTRLAKSGKVKAYRKEDVEDGAFYIPVNQADASELPEIVVGDDTVYIGPFDDAESAANAVGDVDADINVVQSVDGELETAMDGAIPSIEDDEIDVDVDLDECNMQMSGIAESRRKGSKLQLESFRRFVRAKLMKEAVKAVKETQFLPDVDTTVKSGDSVTMDASGSVSNSGTKSPNQPVSDADKEKSISDADVDPNFKGIPDVPKPAGKGELDSNGGDLGSIKENYTAYAIAAGDYVEVKEKGGTVRVDSGIVEAVKDNTIFLNSGGKYNRSDRKYSFIKY